MFSDQAHDRWALRDHGLLHGGGHAGSLPVFLQGGVDNIIARSRRAGQSRRMFAPYDSPTVPRLNSSKSPRPCRFVIGGQFQRRLAFQGGVWHGMERPSLARVAAGHGSARPSSGPVPVAHGSGLHRGSVCQSAGRPGVRRRDGCQQGTRPGARPRALADLVQGSVSVVEACATRCPALRSVFKVCATRCSGSASVIAPRASSCPVRWCAPAFSRLP